MDSDSPKTLYLRGKVFSGKGEGEKFIRLPWVKEQIAKKIGFVPYSGTLNIKLEENSAKLNLLKKTRALEISPAAGFCRGKCFKAHLTDNVECAIVIPEIADYPEDVLEVIAPINLRDKLSLKNGDTVEIKITL
jgi:riboflavin kinase